MISITNKRRRWPVAAICFWVVIFLFMYGLPLIEVRYEPCAINKQGTIDLSSCSTEQYGVMALDGLWEYHPNQLLMSDTSRPKREHEYVQLPHQWNPNAWNPLRDDDINYASYRLKVKLPSDSKDYGIQITNAKTASRLYVDGELIGSRGQVGTSAESSVPYNRPYTSYFSTGQSEVEIVLEVSNFSFYANRGISEEIYIGDKESIHAFEKRKGYSDLAIIACLLFMSIYFLGEIFHRREGRTAIHFPLLCLFVALYFATNGEKVLLDFFPQLSFEIIGKIQLISGAGSGYFFLAHTCVQFQSLASAKLLKVARFHSSFVVAMALLTPMSFYSKFMYYFLLTYMIGLIYIIVLAVRAVKHKLAGSFYMSVSILAIIQVIVLMISKVGWVGTFNHFLPVGIPVFILAQGLLFSSRFTNAYIQIKQLSEQLVNKMKDQEQFLVRTSHELKSPLNAIINISQSMIHGAGGRMNAAQQSDLRLVNATAQRLSYLVKDILDREQVKNGRLRLHKEPIDIYRIVSVVLDIFNRLNRNDKVELRNEVNPGMHYVMADQNRVIQSLYNLLDNALKHTELGSITVSCVHRGEWESITVTDTGVGIEAEKLERIFMEYEQLNRTLYTDTTGIGIGLPITKQLIEMQGGRIHVRSVVGEGSSFTFDLPSVEYVELDRQGVRLEERTLTMTSDEKEVLLTANQQINDAAGILLDGMDTANVRSGISDGGGSGRILLVDDNYASLKALTNLLELEGYTCEAVRSGEAALELLKDGNRFNLCMMDVMMPKMSGFELCRAIRQMYNSLELPVLMATAGSNVQLNQVGFEAGANDFIHKPYDWTDLKGRVNTLVQLKGTVEQLVHSERDMLRAQIKPHFLFNSINTILWMSKRDPDETRRLLHALSDFLRGSFDFDNEKAEVSFSSELSLIQAYLSLESARFGERLKVEYALEEQDFQLPPLLLQPIVENAVRHGVMEKVEGGTVFIASNKIGQWIELTVSDDGVGMDLDAMELDRIQSPSPQVGEKRKGIGLANINRRLRSLYGTSLHVQPRENGGTVITMRIRAEKENV